MRAPPSSHASQPVGSCATIAGSSTLPWTAATGGPSASISVEHRGGAEVAGVEDQVGRAQPLDAASGSRRAPARQVRVGDDREPRHRPGGLGDACGRRTTWLG